MGGAQVLAFATGCPRLPAVGGTAPNFVISINHHAVRSTCTGHCECRSSGTRRLALTRAPMLLQPLEELPTSSTCTSTLNLPPYVTEELTLERLRNDRFACFVVGEVRDTTFLIWQVRDEYPAAQSGRRPPS